MNLDQEQIKLLSDLDKFISEDNSKKWYNQIYKFLSYESCNYKKGYYIQGSVGRGKTLVMKMAFDQTGLNKKLFLHFQEFMQILHKKLHSLRQENVPEQLLHEKLIEYLDISLLCIDEFEIKDIADAMIIKKIVPKLVENGTKIIVTTNIEVENIYLHGVQRESFLPFIIWLKKNFHFVSLISNLDYRFNKIHSDDLRICDQKNRKKNLEILAKELTNNNYKKTILKLYGRELVFEHTYKDILFSNFDELFKENLSSADYITICNHFKIIFIKFIPKISSEELDIITRFINFIDKAYLNRILLFCDLEGKIEDIYQIGSKKSEFNRTISRIFEMNSNAYYENHK